MDLNEAITHYKEKAKELRDDYDYGYDHWNDNEKAIAEGRKECAEEHEQIAEWLEELKRRRELSERNRPISQLLVDAQVENAILRKALELSCIDRSNYKELVDAYLDKARESD